MNKYVVIPVDTYRKNKTLQMPQDKSEKSKRDRSIEHYAERNPLLVDQRGLGDMRHSNMVESQHHRLDTIKAPPPPPPPLLSETPMKCDAKKRRYDETKWIVY